jgi:hypothetical protein
MPGLTHPYPARAIQANSEAINRLAGSLDALSEDIALTKTNKKVDRLADIQMIRTSAASLLLGSLWT